MIEVHSIDLLSIMLYVSIALGAAVLLSRRTAYLKSRYKAGAVSLFIIAMFITLSGLIGMMGTAVWYRFMDIFNTHAGVWYNIQRFLWTTSSIITTVGVWLLVLIDSEDLYDVFLKIRRTVITEEDVTHEQSAGRLDEEIGTKPERFE